MEHLTEGGAAQGSPRSFSNSCKYSGALMLGSIVSIFLVSGSTRLESVRPLFAYKIPGIQFTELVSSGANELRAGNKTIVKLPPGYRLPYTYNPFSISANGKFSAVVTLLGDQGHILVYDNWKHQVRSDFSSRDVDCSSWDPSGTVVCGWSQIPGSRQNRMTVIDLSSGKSLNIAPATSFVWLSSGKSLLAITGDDLTHGVRLITLRKRGGWSATQLGQTDTKTLLNKDPLLRGLPLSQVIATGSLLSQTIRIPSGMYVPEFKKAWGIPGDKKFWGGDGTVRLAQDLVATSKKYLITPNREILVGGGTFATWGRYNEVLQTAPAPMYYRDKREADPRNIWFLYKLSVAGKRLSLKSFRVNDLEFGDVTYVVEQ